MSLQSDQQAPRTFPSSGFTAIDSSVRLEEELIPNYKAQWYYPARIGEVLAEQYQIVGKLGYGSSSTVWLCRHLRLEDPRYIALKIYVNGSKVHRELPIYTHLNRIQSTHSGRRCLRPLLDSFEINGPNGRHICLVHEPLGMSLADLKARARGKVFSEDVLRPSIRQLLAALDFLHNEAHIIHTDLQPNNLLMGIDDKSVFVEYENNEFEHPVPRKILEDRTVYMTRPLPLTFGPPVLCDLSEARFGAGEHTEYIMPDVYRAPEVILGMNWGFKVDIWNVAMIWDLFEPERLFKGRNEKKQYDDASHLAEIIAILGPPPLEFLQRSANTLIFWDESGKWRNIAPIPDLDLRTLETRLEGDDQRDFLIFIRKMLTWIPEEREAAGEVIFDPWLMKGLFD